MRKKFFLALCLASAPVCFVGCDSSADQVGTRTDTAIPPEVQDRIKKQDEQYKNMQQNQLSNPTPVGDGAAPPAGN